jgi:hypothetical protein
LGTHARSYPRRALVHAFNRHWRLRFTASATAPRREFSIGMDEETVKPAIRRPGLLRKLGLYMFRIQL